MQKQKVKFKDLPTWRKAVALIIYIPLMIILLFVVSSMFKGCDSSDDHSYASPEEQARIDAHLDSIDKAKAEAARKQDEAFLKTKAGKIKKKHPEWSRRDCVRILNKEVWIGMTIDMVVYERGLPNSRNDSNFGGGEKYQYCWHDWNPSCFYTREDGIVYAYN